MTFPIRLPWICLLLWYIGRIMWGWTNMSDAVSGVWLVAWFVLLVWSFMDKPKETTDG
jgi:hypothetical protein